MTQDEWLQLGCVRGHLVFGYFNAGCLDNFKVSSNGTGFMVVSTAPDGRFDCSIAKCDTEEQADLIALTLRLTNPAK